MNEVMTNFDGSFLELANSLTLEVKLYGDLDELLKEKQLTIIKGDIESLQKSVHDEQRLIPKI